MSPVPDRWFNYSRRGQVIPGTPFIACKTPLKLTIESENRFTPEDLIESVKDLGKNLVMVIDLTYTRRYYNKDEFKDVLHEKIFTQGHVVPSPDIVSQFFKAVDSVRHTFGKDDVIAVHCTHGVNRTGYFICKYMIDKLNFDPNEAIKQFNLARGHKIERENYLSSLKGESIKIPTDSSYSNKSQGQKGKSYQRQQWSPYKQNPRQFSQNYDWSPYEQNPSPSPQRHRYQNTYNRDRYQDRQRYYQCPETYSYGNRSSSSRYHRQPNYQNNYRSQSQNYHRDDHYNHSSNQFEYHGSSHYPEPKKYYNNSSRQSSYSGRRQKRDRWRDDDCS